ncbi:MAG: 2-amino-4-hydroxy-6-hydroxymethyldihydropteridine diphosphokinase [Gemmatimonadota bacterium]|nr:MAG: 2-amino-4-hydroxy-6-hydroxymethyldihydropteridine diphosphokinase [Gemmatimonadota bacterium]
MAELAYVALGSNIGDRTGNLALARLRLAALPRTTLRGASAVEETAAIGPQPQDDYLNQMVLLETELAPRRLLQSCHEIEREAGRQRSVRWGPRTLDLDIVLFGDLTIDEPDLVIPHPALPHRDFWQREIRELEPYAV